MLIKGKCRGNGSQLATYLLNSKENDHALILAINGSTTPTDLKRSLIEMSLTCQLNGKTSAGLYHTQLSPRTHEAESMTFEEVMRMGEILTKNLGMEGHKWALVEHVKEGRRHYHMAYERYNHDTGKMWNDKNNYSKHKTAAREMEMEFGWQITHDKTNQLERDVKSYILSLWKEHSEPIRFKEVMEKAGFEVVQGIEKRPYQIVDRFGTVHDLTRQLAGVKQAEVSERLNPIRNTLRNTTEACKDKRREHEKQRTELEQSENLLEMSDSQDLMIGMKNLHKQQVKDNEPTKEGPKTYNYSFKFELPPSLPQEVEPLEIKSDKTQEMSESQELAAKMLAQYRQKQIEKRQKAEQLRQETKEQIKTANENKRSAGQDFTDEAAKMLERYRGAQRGGSDREHRANIKATYQL